MLRNLRSLAAITVLLGMLSGCTATTGETLGQNIDDTTLTTSVKTKLLADKLVNLTRIDVDTYNGVVSLNGVVSTPAEKERAEEIAQSVDGVKKVVNNLQVRQA
jgi:hyperosmotically inducible periplasmic protein